jgi:NAD(P)-dependent dehydrogenase (short-subunit alcohol dehydrogenase family)
MNSKIFQGKVAVITGSNRGIGRAIAFEFARNGASVVLNGRDQVKLTETEEELRRINPEVESVCCDVSTEAGGQLLIERTVSRFGRIDFLVNNAGVSIRGNFADLKPEVFRSVYNTNILGAVYPALSAMSYLRLTAGSIVFISSVAGIRGLPSLSAYSSSKMALRALAESIRIEEFRHNIHVGLICVGPTEIDEGKAVMSADGTPVVLDRRTGRGVQSQEDVARAVIRNISKRKFITVLTFMGKLNAFLQPRFPGLVERLILRNLKKFEEGYK